MKRLIFFFLILTATQSAWAQLSPDSFYVSKAELPNAGYYLPAPPDTASMDYVDDIIQWQWGKTQRPLPRGRQASDESLWLPAIMQRVMAEALGLDTISAEATPALARLLVKCYNTGDSSTHAAKVKYMRIRPFVQMGDGLWAQWDTDYLRTNGSYPSGHTAFGWATALAFAEMWPELQDTILRRGFQFGENRIITGAHYQSDVNAGYMCGAAGIARAHVNPDFEKDILAARAEYRRLKGLPKDYDPTASVDLPRGDRFLNPPVDTASYRYPGDIARYWNAKPLRLTERGDSAVRNGDHSQAYLLQYFGNAIGLTLSAESTPAIVELLSNVHEVSKLSAYTLKRSNFRKRPYVQMGEPTPLPQWEKQGRTESSFASAHANMAWALALVLSEVAPECNNEILRIGFNYGYDRLIVGYHWASDIEAGRLLACAVVARLHANAEFLKQIKKARMEYLRIKRNN